MSARCAAVALFLLLSASTVSVVWALQVVVTGYNIISATYATTDKYCTGGKKYLPTSVTYVALGVCHQPPSGTTYVIASADVAGSIYLSPYSDAACKVSLGPDTKAPSQTCVNGVSTNQYSVVAPDAIFNVQPPGLLVATSIAYAASDTTCAQTPTQATYVTTQLCYSPTASQSTQYIVDNSGNVFSQSFTGTTTCAAGKGLVTVQLQPTQKCGPGPASLNVFGAFPAALIPQINQVYTVFAGDTCFGFVAPPLSATVYFAGGPVNTDYTCQSGCVMPENGQFSYALNCPTNSYWTNLVAPPATRFVSGHVTVYSEYSSADTTCTGNPKFVAYTALGVCTPRSNDLTRQLYYIYSADASGNIYLSTYYDTACTLPTTALYVKQTVQKCVGGRYSQFLYSAQPPDSFIKVNTTLPAGAVLLRTIQYSPGDTTCANTPVYLTTTPVNGCTLLAAVGPGNLGSAQYIADNSGTLYYKQFTGTTTCAPSKGLTITNLFDTQSVVTTCAATAAGPRSQPWKVIPPLPSTLTSMITSTVSYYPSFGSCSAAGALGPPFATRMYINGPPCTFQPCSAEDTSSTVSSTRVSASTTCPTVGLAAGSSPTAAPTMNPAAVCNALSTSGAAMSASLNSAMASAGMSGIVVSNAACTASSTGVSVTQNIPSGVTVLQASTGQFQDAFKAAAANVTNVPKTSVTNMTVARGRRLLAGVTLTYAINQPGSAGTVSTTSNNNGGSSTSSSSCFAASELVTLENGATKAISEVAVGDRILTVNAQTGKQVYSDVAYVPHGKNAIQATFVTIATAAGRDVKMTANHVLPAGACGLTTLPYVSASSVVVGDCVETASGRERVVSVSTVVGEGIYTVVAMEELVVVNGVVATPYGGVNPTLANVYYNLHRLAYQVCGANAMKRWVQAATEGLWLSLSQSRLAAP